MKRPWILFRGPNTNQGFQAIDCASEGGRPWNLKQPLLAKFPKFSGQTSAARRTPTPTPTPTVMNSDSFSYKLAEKMISSTAKGVKFRPGISSPWMSPSKISSFSSIWAILFVGICIMKCRANTECQVPLPYQHYENIQLVSSSLGPGSLTSSLQDVGLWGGLYCWNNCAAGCNKPII